MHRTLSRYKLPQIALTVSCRDIACIVKINWYAAFVSICRNHNLTQQFAVKLAHNDACNVVVCLLRLSLTMSECRSPAKTQAVKSVDTKICSN